MANIIAISLVCAATVSAQDCTVHTALDVVQTPVDTAIPTACLMIGQSAVAAAHLIEAGDTNRYVRVLCRPRREIAAAEPAAR